MTTDDDAKLLNTNDDKFSQLLGQFGNNAYQRSILVTQPSIIVLQMLQLLKR
eukprot:01274.XXX_3986_3811_1 [CDS] Oithona nana genome sequencing.